MDLSELQDIKYLNNISSPNDFKKIPDSCMPCVAEEIRKELVRIVSKNGGHLASNLGVVELTMAIHQVFDCPKDHIIFDVGHQSYVHKMLTGRYQEMDSIRQPGGISGFTSRTESEYDAFGAGHSSTSLSASLGFAIADKLNGSKAYTVCIIGDGAYTGGMIHEALNNCKRDLNLIIVINENEMSISKNIGRFAKHLSKIRIRSGYLKTKKFTGKFIRKIPLIGKPIFRFLLRVKRLVKNTLYGSNYFEKMGIRYLGPADGNDYATVKKLLEEAKKHEESVIVHLKTKKGKGFEPAEKFPEIYHGMSPDMSTNEKAQKNFSHIMGEELVRIADENKNVCAITAAMADGTGLVEFSKKYNDRFFDVGIAEGHALTFAAGLAANNKKPFVAVYSTFLQRAYDNIIHDVALQKLPVVIGIDRAGLNFGDGATHHGIFDVSFLSGIPDITLYAPISSVALKECMRAAFDIGSTVAIRYPNATDDAEILDLFYSSPAPLGIKKDFSIGTRKDVIIITYGRIVKEAIAAKAMLKERGIETGIILLELIKPYEFVANLIKDVMPDNSPIVVFLEEEIKQGGMGMNLSDVLIDIGVITREKSTIIATDNSFVKNVEKNQNIYEAAGVDRKSIFNKIISAIK